MNKFKFILHVTLISTMLITSCRETNVLSEEELGEGWQLLFNGDNLDGWRNYNGEPSSLTTWGVDRGMLISSGTGTDSTGYIITEAQYENFIVTFDWKIEEGGNSGFLYHVLERPGYDVPYITGPEYQLIDEENFDEPLEPWQTTAADYAMYAPDTSVKLQHRAGRWNRSRIVFDNGSVEYWLNGQKVVSFDAWTDDWFSRKANGKWKDYPEYGLSRNGHFALQDHGSRTWFRNIKIKVLPRKPGKEVLFNGEDLSGWQEYGTEQWYVENGEIVCKSGPAREYGYLATSKYYDDFDLTLEFRQVSNGNSGVFIRSYIPSGVNVSGWQVEIAPPGNHTGGIYESYGRGWLTEIPPEKEDLLMMGEWNEMRIRAEGNNIKTWLNGEPVTELNDEQVGKGRGRVMLQIHRGGRVEMRFRKILLQEL